MDCVECDCRRGGGEDRSAMFEAANQGYDITDWDTPGCQISRGIASCRSHFTSFLVTKPAWDISNAR